MDAPQGDLQLWRRPFLARPVVLPPRDDKCEENSRSRHDRNGECADTDLQTLTRLDLALLGVLHRHWMAAGRAVQYTGRELMLCGRLTSGGIA